MAKDIPDGWSQASVWDVRKSGFKKGESPSGLYRLILNACERGSIRAYKDGGRWIVNRNDVDGLAAEFDLSKQKTSSAIQEIDLVELAQEVRAELLRTNKQVTAMIQMIHHVSEQVKIIGRENPGE